MNNHLFSHHCSLAKDAVIDPTLQVFGVAAVPDKKDPDTGHLVIITEAGLMNTLQFYQESDVPLYVTFDLWAGVCASVYMLHNKKIIHQDLKPENILITAVSLFDYQWLFLLLCEIYDE